MAKSKKIIKDGFSSDLNKDIYKKFGQANKSCIVFC